MGFSLSLSAEIAPNLDPGIIAVLGTIEIGLFRERFVTSLMYWSVGDYMRQWREGLDRIVQHHSSTSCLITSIVDPTVSTHLFWWPMYLEGDIVHFQNSILFFDQLDVPFRGDDPYASVQKRRTITDEGYSVSEWAVEIAEIEDFLSKMVVPE